jgi:hypothetical protein
MTNVLKISRCTVAAGLVCLAAAAHADGWPISFAKLSVPGSAYGGVSSMEPVRDCQPELFDPKVNAYHPLTPAPAPAAQAASGVGAAPAAPALTAYAVEGGEPGETMTINGRIKPDDAKIELPGSVALRRYFFSCPTGSSEALEFEKNGKPYAIFAHVAQVRFTPDLNTVVFYNSAKLTHHGGWTKMRAIFNIPKKRFAPLPMIQETRYLADVGGAEILTYGMPRSPGKPATVAVWNLGGKLIRAFSVPLQPAADGNGTSDPIGLLPDEEGTLYHLARSGENAAELRLQDLRNPKAHRAIALAVPGAAADPVGARVQLDLSGLTLKDGAVKYRVSASGKGGDWGAWQAAQ